MNSELELRNKLKAIIFNSEMVYYNLRMSHQYAQQCRNQYAHKPGFEITTEIVNDSHDYHGKNFVVHDFLVG